MKIFITLLFMSLHIYAYDVFVITLIDGKKNKHNFELKEGETYDRLSISENIAECFVQIRDGSAALSCAVTRDNKKRLDIDERHVLLIDIEKACQAEKSPTDLITFIDSKNGKLKKVRIGLFCFDDEK